ncbi:MAG: DMT family transporter, partial [Candidatus Omnitrophica bacterium]|nr:DMT family transporter [Candidatus Omnitrophota bacterium]
AIAKLSLGTAVILNYTAPIFVAIIATLFLKEKISNLLWLLIFMCFIGLYLLVEEKLSFKSFPIFIGLFSGFWAALAFVTIRTAIQEESSYTIIFYFTTISTLGSIPLLYFGFQIPNVTEWAWLLGIAITSFFGQVFLTTSIREAPASIVCPFSYLAPVFSFFFGFTIWKDPLTIHMILGAGLVILSGVFIYLIERRPEPVVE